MIYVSNCCNLVLHFLAAPVDFVDVPQDTPQDKQLDAFVLQFKSLKQHFDSPLSASASSPQKKDDLAPIELFGTIDPSEVNKYSDYMASYWEEIMCGVEVEREALKRVQKDPTTDVIKRAMSAKVKAIHCGLMGKVYGDPMLNKFPIPTKLLVYSLGEQLRSIEPVIKEMVEWFEPLTVFGLEQRPPMWKDHLQALEHFISTKLGTDHIHRLVQDLIKELGMCSELAIHQCHCPAEPFVNLSSGELEDLYPIDWAEPMSEAQLKLYTEKQGNAALHAMDALPTFKNDSKHLWVMEKNAEQIAKDKMRELADAYRDVKTVQSVRSACAVQVAARMNQRQPKSLEFIEDSGDEDTPLEADPSKTTEDRNAGSSTTQGPAKWTLEQAGHGDEDRHVPGLHMGGIQGCLSDQKYGIGFKTLPAILHVVLMVLDVTRGNPEAKGLVDNLTKMLLDAKERPAPNNIYGPLFMLQNFSCKGPQYLSF
ncbi:hypothetical protein BKA82DRAFT_10380 [Pisolithus tinctorius]|uniref:Uncharacterized protein n=1 Tax=Pisolithus tinctorius Marx 270 TaxID=870435 RepID=A0A0C3IRI7_PISTI|nr:hypothetical protein BKA82DRAFT_10380 [Pisolithus tinctorius]KIN99537.1 hypothetical protein M404DRAFT_10380 [Pisolithus tinctorius Marx 270]